MEVGAPRAMTVQSPTLLGCWAYPSRRYQGWSGERSAHCRSWTMEGDVESGSHNRKIALAYVRVDSARWRCRPGTVLPGV